MAVVRSESDGGGVVWGFELESTCSSRRGERVGELLSPGRVGLAEPLADFGVTQCLRPELEEHRRPLRRSVVREETFEHAADCCFRRALVYSSREGVGAV